MDARDRLRQYLEQRRELGEDELVLDGMPVDDLMRLLGASATRGAPGRAADRAVAGPRRESARRAALEAMDTPSLDDLKAAAKVAKAAVPAKPAAPAAAPTSAPDPARASQPAAQAPQAGTPIIVGGMLEDAAGEDVAGLGTLAELAAAVAACKRCALHATATNAVPGEGDPNAKFVCVGEAPGATEDETGRPFVGAAGQLLTKILAAVNLPREEVFICNVLKHRPPGNRNPAADEIAACSPFLLQQLALLRPKVILALGTFAAQTLLQTTTPIGKLRGQVHRFYGVPLVVTYHPAALLRNPNWKRPTWEDVQLARKILDSP